LHANFWVIILFQARKKPDVQIIYTKLFKLNSDEILFKICYDWFGCGVSIPVVRCLPKAEKRVRFSYPAHCWWFHACQAGELSHFVASAPSPAHMPKEIYTSLISPLLSNFDSEKMHKRAINALHVLESRSTGLKLVEYASYGHKRFTDERLSVELGGVMFENPLVVGAGWDKAGKAVQGLYALGFAGVEVGTVTMHSQEGNPQPRQFLIDRGVALNRMGFNSPGMEAVAHNLERYKESGIPVGVSLGKNKDVEPQDAPEAHAQTARTLYEYASYFAINVSSPNTPGLRRLQDKSPLTDNVQALNDAMHEMGGRKPTFIKIAPELSREAVDDVIQVVQENGLTGIIAANTTVRPELKAKYGERWRTEDGGLSGDDEAYSNMVKEKIAHIYKITDGEVKVIGSGGAKDTDTTLQLIKAGATIVQFVTGIRAEGPALPGKINRGLVECMEKEGIVNIREIVGLDVN
jgi:dihydroorotate dehydrogenase